MSQHVLIEFRNDEDQYSEYAIGEVRGKELWQLTKCDNQLFRQPTEMRKRISDVTYVIRYGRRGWTGGDVGRGPMATTVHAWKPNETNIGKIRYAPHAGHFPVIRFFDDPKLVAPDVEGINVRCEETEAEKLQRRNDMSIRLFGKPLNERWWYGK